MDEQIESQDDTGDTSEEPNYKLCLLYDVNKPQCGPFIRDRAAQHGLSYIGNLTASTDHHFEFLKMKLPKSWIKWSEKQLIENRLGYNLAESDQICEHHRHSKGVEWRPLAHCAHPDHPPRKVGSKLPKSTLAPLWLVEQVNSTEDSFPIGGKVCYKHLQMESNKKKEQSTEKEAEHDHESDQEPENDEDDARDENYEPGVPVCPPDVQCSSKDIGNKLMETLGLSPIRFQVTRTSVRDMSTSLRQTIERKIDQATSKIKETIAESIAPTQGVELIDELYGPDDIPADLKPLIVPYETSDARGKLIILSLVDHSKHSKSFIQKVFDCTKYAVEKARKLQPAMKGITIPTKEKFHRNRLNLQKCEHFVEFLFASGMLQDVAYGVSKLHFDNGSVQTIPHAVLTAKFSHVIAFYLAICKETGFVPVSESSLWRILRSLNPSQRKSLAGLDDITADGMNAFAKLDDFLSRRKKDKSLRDRLERGKRYLKTTYQGHCSLDSSISSHNAAFALSTEKEEPCLEINDRVCSDCFALMEILEETSGIAIAEGSEDDQYDVRTSIEAVLRYMKHQIRDHQQRKAKTYAFDHLTDETAFWLKDFAQKVIPIRYREGQREYFGKKGMSLHIDVFFRQQEDRLLKYVYMTCLFRCKQSKVDVLNQESWHAFMVLLINVSDFPVSLTTHADNISWPITGLQFMTEKKGEKDYFYERSKFLH